jgi:DNA topoisomerase-2
MPQLPIWSLTQERVDKLKQQMVNKKEEHDHLAGQSEKDLWCIDLDAFVQEWEAQLREDADLEKTIRNSGRRASRKIGAGRTTKGRAKKDDDDFNPTKAKAAKVQTKIVTKVEPKPHKGFLEMFQAKPKPKANGFDGAEESGLSDDDFAALESAKPSKQTSRAPSEQPVAGPANGRGKRAAAAGPKTWVDDDEESESDDGKFLGDVGAMVKGIGGDTVDTNATNGRLSLFQMSRPGTSHGDRPTSSSGLPKLKTKPSRVFDVSDIGDETNYEMLAKSSPHKAHPPKDNLDSFLSDDDDLVPITKKVPVKAAPAAAAKPVAKRGRKPKAAAVPEKPAPVDLKPTALSPAAKAYAAKQSKLNFSKKNVFSDDDDDDIEMNDSPPPKPAVKPAAAAKTKTKAKAPVKRNVISDDEDDDLEMNNSPPPKPAAAGRGRPARAAVAKAKSTRPVYIDSDDDSMEVDDLEVSAVVEDDESEDDFNDSD